MNLPTDHYEFADALFAAVVETLRLPLPPRTQKEQDAERAFGSRVHRKAGLGGKRIA